MIAITIFMSLFLLTLADRCRPPQRGGTALLKREEFKGRANAPADRNR
jgi:hypothetical protein